MEGIDRVSRLLGRYRDIFGVCLFLWILWPALWTSTGAFRNGYEGEETRPALLYLRDHIQPTDIVLYNNSAQYAYRYYLKSLGIVDRMAKKVTVLEGGPVLAGPFSGKFSDRLGREAGQRYGSFCFERYFFDLDGFYKGRMELPRPLRENVSVFESARFNVVALPRVWIFFSLLIWK